ncbi:phage tail tape measure protein [Paenibacillus contaminans]|uniref:Phage tail tape measure protein n=1 Tax=Paenibacillus contaminans TaxID=450362 RepID=A0A329MRT2_9BACL|nr:phage tail tape measure protein [Paenibacillus contaminans]RAV22681.1 phage tail tape measure protein [Paenibacillus contaminans]
MANTQERLGMRAELDDKPFLQALARIEKQLNKLNQMTNKMGTGLDKSLQKPLNSMKKMEAAISKLEKSISKVATGNQKLGNSINTMNTHMNRNVSIAQRQTSNYTRQAQAISRLNTQLTTYTRNSQTAARTAQQTAQATASATSSINSGSTNNGLYVAGSALDSLGNQMIAGGATAVYGSKGLADKYESFAKNQLRIYVLEDGMGEKEYREMQNKSLKTAKKYGVDPDSFSRGMYDAISVMDSYKNFEPNMELLAKSSMGFLVDPTVSSSVMSTGFINFNLDNDEKMRNFYDSMYAMVKTSKAEMSELAPYVSEIAPWFANGDPNKERAYEEMFTLYGAVSKTHRPAQSATMTQRFMQDFQNLTKNLELNKAIQWLNEESNWQGEKFDYLDTGYMRKHGSIQTALQAEKVYKALKSMEGDPEVAEHVQAGSFFGQSNTKKFLETLGNNNFRALNESINNMANKNGMLDEAYNKIKETDEGKYMAAKERLDAELIELGREITPVMADLVEALNGVLGAVNSLPDWVKKLITTIVVWGGAMSIIGGGLAKAVGIPMKTIGGVGRLFGKGGTAAARGAATATAAGSTAATAAASSSGLWGTLAATGLGSWFGNMRNRVAGHESTRLSSDFNRLSNRVGSTTTRMGRLSQNLGAVVGRFPVLDGALGRLTQNFKNLSLTSKLVGGATAVGTGVGAYATTSAVMNANDGYILNKVNDYFMKVSDSKWGFQHLLPWNGAIKGLDTTFELMGLGGFGMNWGRSDIGAELNEKKLDEIKKKGYEVDEVTGQLIKIEDNDPWTESPNDNTQSPYYGKDLLDRDKKKKDSGFEWHYNTPDRVNFVEMPTLRKMMDITGGQSAKSAATSSVERSKQTITNNLGGITFNIPQTDNLNEVRKMIETAMTKVLTDLSKNTGRGGSTLNSSSRV